MCSQKMTHIGARIATQKRVTKNVGSSVIDTTAKGGKAGQARNASPIRLRMQGFVALYLFARVRARVRAWGGGRADTTEPWKMKKEEWQFLPLSLHSSLTYFCVHTCGSQQCPPASSPSFTLPTAPWAFLRAWARGGEGGAPQIDFKKSTSLS